MNKITLEEFIERSNLVHNNKYDYSKVVYVNNSTKVCIICPKHGEFWQTPAAHLRGSGCSKCEYEKTSERCRKTQETFIKEAKNVHGEKYDYSKVEYVDNKTKVCIICPKHGEFWQAPTHHIQRKHGCPKCNHENSHLTQEEFVKKAKLIHGEKYDYSESHFTKMTTKIKIICPTHGEFWQTPYKHIKESQGCPRCTGKYPYTTEEWINMCNKKHNNKYDYTKSVYVNYDEKVCIVCPKHGEFWQSAGQHLSGHGCPVCNESKIEKEINDALKSNNYIFERQYTEQWLKHKHKLFVDFYIPDKKIAIECQGLQHFMPVDFAGLGKEWAEKLYLENIERDKIKKKLCENHGITVLYYTNINDIVIGDNTFNNINLLLNKIKTLSPN